MIIHASMRVYAVSVSCVDFITSKDLLFLQQSYAQVIYNGFSQVKYKWSLLREKAKLDRKNVTLFLLNVVS
jgi:hypothetical protein